MEGDIQVFNNVKDSRYIKMGLLGTVIILSILILYASIKIPKWPLVILIVLPIVLVLFSSTPFIIAWKMEYLRRPYKIEIGSEGLIMHQYYHSKPDLVSWDEVLCIYSASSDPSISKDRVVKDGFLAIRNERKKYGRQLLTLNTNIADAAREKYREVIGNYPPLRSETGTIH